MSRTNEQVKQGGLMRCCLGTLEEDIMKDRPEHTPQNGEILKCKWCKEGSMMFQNGVWSWNRGVADAAR